MAKFRYSASLISVFKICPFRFYCKTTGQEQDPDQNMVYADSGQVLHKCMEYYYEHLLELDREAALQEMKNYFNTLWEHLDINSPVINKEEYWLSVLNSIKLNIIPTHTELEFRLDYDMKPLIKDGVYLVPDEQLEDKTFFIGYGDAVNTVEHWIGDWKTSSYKRSKLDKYEVQLKYYAWAYWKTYGVIPRTWVYFTKVDKLFKFAPTIADMQEIEKEMVQINTEVQQRFKEMKFERRPSKTNCFFCPYKGVCSTNLLRENKAKDYEVKFYLRGHKLLVEAVMPTEIQRKIEAECNFEIKNAHFIVQAMRKKGIQFDGMKRLYRRKDYGGDTFIGFANKIYLILKNYAESQGWRIKFSLVDQRNADIKAKKNEIEMPDRLNTDYDPYKFQTHAVEALMKSRWGICEIGTGGGKTDIAAECIRRLNTKTLFIIDNKDLLLQTKKEYERLLGIECGIVGMGYREWHQPITLSTIQTLEKHCKEFETELAQVNLVIYDETHIIASKSFEKVSKFLSNTTYRFGFSATARRDDGNDKIIYAHTGEVVYKKPAFELIEEGVLTRPECYFYDYADSMHVSEQWHNEYQDNVVENEQRNELIKQIVESYTKEGKQVMVLCKMIRHCNTLLEMIPGSKLIYGQTDDDLRVEVLEEFKEKKFNVLIGNIKIFNKGINIKNLDVLINAAGNAGDVTTIQSIGRALRKAEGKDKAYYIDFLDKGVYTTKHSYWRIEALKREAYNVEILNIRSTGFVCKF